MGWGHPLQRGQCPALKLALDRSTFTWKLVAPMSWSPVASPGDHITSLDQPSTLTVTRPLPQAPRHHLALSLLTPQSIQPLGGPHTACDREEAGEGHCLPQGAHILVGGGQESGPRRTSVKQKKKNGTGVKGLEKPQGGDS